VAPGLLVAVTLLGALAGRDDVAPPALCEEFILRSAGRVEVRTSPAAPHAFDVSDPLPSEAARQAWSEALTHLQVRLP
jgi:dienelactone hydrolase